MPAAALLLLSGAWQGVAAQATVQGPPPLPPLEPSPALEPPPRGAAAQRLPIVLQARTLQGQPGLATVAEGEVEFRRGGLVIRADRIAYDTPEDRAQARGAVRIETPQAVYAGTELTLSVQRFEGAFLDPSFELPQLGAGGRATRIDFLGPGRSSAQNARYTSCPRDQAGEPDWVLQADRVQIDLVANEGIADGAVLRFLGTPILALPALSFPLGDTRKSGWLPPSVNIDNRSGVELSVPWYWNIAPNRDATLAPRIITRRGVGLDAEFRYLEPRFDGELRLDLLPDDRLVERARGAIAWRHDSRLPMGLEAAVDLYRVSDNDWWRDFPNRTRGTSTRLLSSRAALERPFAFGAIEGQAYARLAHWQVLQAVDAPIVAPYQRSPQLGVAARGERGGWQFALETEFNRFELPAGAGSAGSTTRVGGERVHLLGALSRPLRDDGVWVVPRIAVNAAAYGGDALAARNAAAGSTRRGRIVPTFSLDSGVELERSTAAFGRELRQTLEPRVLYVHTPYRRQADLPAFDAAAKDFNFVSIYSDNSFAGVDRVADLHQVTAGVTTRLVDAASGAEALRLGLVQRFRLRPQRVAAQADGSPDGPEQTQRLSDALLLGSTSVFPAWTLDAAVQYSPDIQRAVRTILGARYSPAPFRTVGVTYRFTRGLAEQVELGWQWPLYEGAARAPAAGGGAGGCRGSWYSVGRVNYSTKDSRVTDSILGLEYDAGCWIGRVVAERLSTGRSQATTRLLLQLELVGLSRLGSNPLGVLKDNIPGYRLLREERAP